MHAASFGQYMGCGVGACSALTAPPCVKATLLNAQGDDIINLAPKKANWALRREVGKGLEKLDRRTQRALVAIMQEQQQPLDQDGAQ